jgi:hypothetical protein
VIRSPASWPAVTTACAPSASTPSRRRRPDRRPAAARSAGPSRVVQITADGLRDPGGCMQGGGLSSYRAYSGRPTTQPAVVWAHRPRPGICRTWPRSAFCPPTLMRHGAAGSREGTAASPGWTASKERAARLTPPPGDTAIPTERSTLTPTAGWRRTHTRRGIDRKDHQLTLDRGSRHRSVPLSSGVDRCDNTYSRSSGGTFLVHVSLPDAVHLRIEA